MKNVSTLLSGAVLAVAIGNAFAAGSPGVEHHTQAFLQALEAGSGKPLESLFVHFEREPVASASVAQVHAAGLDYLPKPVKPAALRALLSRHVSLA
mgnify:CR=1 FL=1